MCFTQQTISLSLGRAGVCVIQGTLAVLILFPLNHPDTAFYGLCSDQTISKGVLKLSSLAFLKIKQNKILKGERRVCVNLCGLRSSPQTRSERHKWARNALDILSCLEVDSAQKLPLQLKPHLTYQKHIHYRWTKVTSTFPIRNYLEMSQNEVMVPF